jgi:hypothetical protein
MNCLHFPLVTTDEIIASTGNAKVEVQHLDLSSLASVRKFANNIINPEPHLDVLINTAGATRVKQKITEDGILLGMQVNHFGPFLLTCLLTGKFIIIFYKVRDVKVWSKAWICGRSLTRIVGLNPTGGMDVCLL